MGSRVRTIVVIDDNPSMLQGLSRLLSAHGFRVQTFASAESFLEDATSVSADCLLLATRQEAFDAGCIAYLRKPFLSKLLIDAINSVR